MVEEVRSGAIDGGNVVRMRGGGCHSTNDEGKGVNEDEVVAEKEIACRTSEGKWKSDHIHRAS